MEMKELSIEAVDFDDQTFRISEILESVVLEASLREVGQLNPVTLLCAPGMPGTIVCGFRRLHALRNLGHRSILVRSLTLAECTPLQAFRTALWDNLPHRQLNPLEKARILHTLKHTCGVEHDVLVKDYLPLLELAPHKNVLRSYLGLHALHAGLKTVLLDGRLTLASAERFCARPVTDQAFLAHLFEMARWSASLQRRVLDLADDLAMLDGCSATAVFGRPEIEAVLEDFRLSPFQKGERVYELLYRRRYPRLSIAEKRFLDEKKKLGLPGSIRLTPEPFFETSCVHVEFAADTAQGFREISAALQQAAVSPGLDNLFDVD